MLFCLALGLWASSLAGVSGCGYRAVYGQASASKFSVGSGQVLVPELGAPQAALSGARAELSAAGALGPADTFPRLTLDVLRVDELSRGVRVTAGQPQAAAMSVAVVVRGRLFPGEGQESTLDTGDLRRSVQLAGDADPRVDSAAYDAAVRAAAERAGRAAARAALGIPEPADETP